MMLGTPPTGREVEGVALTSAPHVSAWTQRRIGMVSRREFLIAVVAASAAAAVGRWATVLASVSQPATPVNFDVPAGACDCHVHVFGDPQRFPFSPSRTYTPELASVEEMRVLHRALHTDRVVVVNPSVYGTDNSCTLDAVKQLGSSARAVAVIDDKTPDAALDQMDRAGVRGIRINLETGGQADPALARERFQAGVERIKGRKHWHIQVYARLSVIEAAADLIKAAPMPVVFDHFGGAKAALGVAQPGFGTLLKLVRSGKAYVKLSGAYRSSTLAPDYPDIVPLAKALIAENAERILWGTDWPHPAQVPGRKTEVSPLIQIDDGRLFNQLAVWAPEAAMRKTILVENPARLYGF
jgi:predicted TIM-barrel fold metal-dependent hydrolase